MIRYFDRNGEPISAAEWAGLSKSEEYRRIAWDELGLCVVSTVWTGLPAHVVPGVRPAIFETLVFYKAKDLLALQPSEMTEIDCRRYPTEAEARAGHEAALAWCRAGKYPRPSDPETE